MNSILYISMNVISYYITLYKVRNILFNTDNIVLIMCVSNIQVFFIYKLQFVFVCGISAKLIITIMLCNR